MKQIEYSLRNILGILLLVSSVVACREEVLNPGFSDKDIAFYTQLTSRADAFTENGASAYKTIGVTAISSSTDWSEGRDGTVIMRNTELTRVGGSDGWSYSPSTPWPLEEKVSFFAYAPYRVQGLTLSSASGATVNSRPVLQFSVQDNPENQTDLLIADGCYNLTDTTGAVRLVMRHALTRLLFSAKVANAVHPDSIIKITQVKLSGIKKDGEHVMDFAPQNEWTVAPTETAYILQNNNRQLKDTALTQTLKQITLGDGNLYLIPQSLAQTAKLSITFQTFYKDLVSATPPVTIEKSMNEILDNWKPGEAIRYILTVPNSAKPESFEITYQHIPWESKEIEVSLEADPYLDITNVNLHTYDAAATRVYFYSNQPADKVYIDSIGKVSTNSGANFQVKDEFYAIAQGDPDGTGCFHYDYNPGIGTGMGYIDLINRNTTTAGEGPNKGKHPLILKLRAGNIVRDITVQPTVTEEAAKLNATPYIGTFHRWNETGERIVTWHLPPNVEWKATIKNIGTHDKLIIDRLASPDFENNILYSFNPRTPEGANVDPAISGGGSFVKGKGRVYFRVGWKGFAPSPYVAVGDTNRYAKIEVTYPFQSGAPGDTTVQLFCRQGENPHQVAAAPSLFSVYNVGLFRQFTKYPTQAGMIYQWDRTYGWDPLELPKPPAYPNDFETDFNHERSACPDGYVYPSTLQVTEMTAVFALKLKQWGYYADGFFDRRRITSGDHRVEASTLEVAAAGIMFYNPTNARAIFLPTAGYRKANTAPIDSLGQLSGVGTHSGYWTDSTDVTTPDLSAATGMILHKEANAESLAGYNKKHGFSLRCVKAPAWRIVFDANGGENAPLTLTIPLPLDQNEVTTHLPTTQPNEYWKNGWRFTGWNTKKDGSGTTYAAGAEILLTADVTLYAQWTP